MNRATAEEIEALRRSGALDVEWYLARHPDVRSLGLDPFEHFLRFGTALGRSASADEEAQSHRGPDLGGASSTPQALARHFLGRERPHGSPDESAPRAENIAPGAAAHAAALDAVRRRLCEGSHEKQLLALEGVLHLRAGAMDEAHRVWDLYWRRSKADPAFAEARPLRLAEDPSANERFTVAKRNPPGGPAADAAPRFCVYTAMYGNYDNLASPLFNPRGVNFVCFTDSAADRAGWQCVQATPAGADPVLNSRYVKMLPHRVLPGYDFSIYVDANHLVLADVAQWVRTWLAGKRFVAWAHPQRSDIYDEFEAILVNLRHEPHSVLREVEKYRSEGMPRGTGLVEAAVLWRSHRDPEVVSLMEAWWRDFGLCGKRDQPVLSYQMWKSGTRPQVMPSHLGNARESEFTAKTLHNAPDDRLVETRAPVDRRPGKPRRVAWLYRQEAKSVASTVMRGRQLTEFLARGLSDRLDITYLNEHETADLTGSVVVLTKGFLKSAHQDEVECLKVAGNILCGDYVDQKIRDELDDFIDVYIASSIRQLVELKRSKPQKLVHMITHHADPAIKEIRGPEDYLNVGYFGEIVNAKYAVELQGKIDFCLTDTRSASSHWINRLRHCNMHYAVRQRRDADGYKPFLKGFTAAQCGANIMVPAFEGDARYYLGSGYPFMLHEDTLDAVRGMLDFAADAFGGPLWHEGLQVMASVRERSRPEYICDEAWNLFSRL